jgi:hypothetical protein
VISIVAQVEIEDASVRGRREAISVVVSRARREYNQPYRHADKDAHELWNSSQMECRCEHAASCVCAELPIMCAQDGSDSEICCQTSQAGVIDELERLGRAFYSPAGSRCHTFYLLATIPYLAQQTQCISPHGTTQKGHPMPTHTIPYHTHLTSQALQGPQL